MRRFPALMLALLIAALLLSIWAGTFAEPAQVSTDYFQRVATAGAH